jgi:transcriptional regulator NrdR family protein
LAEPRATTDEGKPVGLFCPDCGCAHFIVWRTRPIPRGIRRERRCRHCGRTVITTERFAGG